MTRLETLILLTEILEAIQHFEDRIEYYLYNDLSKAYNLNDIHTYGMCIDRLNERFTKQLNTLK